MSHNGREWYVFLRTTQTPDQIFDDYRDRMRLTKRSDSEPLFTSFEADVCHAWIRKNKHLMKFPPHEAHSNL
jgi:hypothetical protein